MKNIFSILQLALISLIVCLSMEFYSSTAFYITAGVVLGVSALIGKQISGVAGMAISVEEARGMFTNATVAIYNDAPMVKSFLRSFFKPVYKATKYVNIEVIRNNERRAVDVIRGTGPNMRKRKRSSQKTLLPPCYHLGQNVNELDIYDLAIGAPTTENIINLAEESAAGLVELTKEIERAHEYQASQVMLTGIITLANGDNIDFGRKAGSIVDGGAGTYWTVTTVDPMVALENAGDWIRQEGKAQGDTFNVIMGADAFNAMKNNPIFQANYDLKNCTYGEMHEPQRNSVGGTLQGRVSAGSYKFNVWTYIEGDEGTSGSTFTKYIDDNKFVVLPEVTNFVEASCQVPMLIGDPAFVSQQNGKFVLKDYIDANHTNHRQEILNCTVMIPVAIDQIYTQRVTA